MRLKNWRRTKGLSQDALAKLLGVHQTCVSKLELGATRPQGPLAQRILEVTENEVTPNDFYDLPAAPAGQGEEAAA